MIAVVVGVALAMRGGREETRTAQNYTPARQPTTQTQPPVVPSHQQPTAKPPQMTTEERVPAHFTSPPSTASLRATLDPEQFTGPTREAYRAVKEIPQTIAQLPCYCYCDEGFGHKSLHSCFEDDHGAHCAVCVNEVLMAYRMEKEMHMTPVQIRESIIAQYSRPENAPYGETDVPDKKKSKMTH